MTRENSWIALDASPDPEVGSVRKHFVDEKPPKPTPYAEVLTGDALHAAQANGEQLWMLHRQTCSAKKEFNPRPAHITLNLPSPARRSAHR